MGAYAEACVGHAGVALKLSAIPKRGLKVPDTSAGANSSARLRSIPLS